MFQVFIAFMFYLYNFCKQFFFQEAFLRTTTKKMFGILLELGYPWAPFPLAGVCNFCVKQVELQMLFRNLFALCTLIFEWWYSGWWFLWGMGPGTISTVLCPHKPVDVPTMLFTHYSGFLGEPFPVGVKLIKLSLTLLVIVLGQMRVKWEGENTIMGTWRVNDLGSWENMNFWICHCRTIYLSHFTNFVE